MFSFFNPKVVQISVDEVKKALDENENVVLLDVRTPSEFKRERIKGSINLPLRAVSTKIESLIEDKKQRIYICCLSGSRSAFAADEMKKMGYKNVFNVTSGLLAWRAKRYPLVT